MIYYLNHTPIASLGIYITQVTGLYDLSSSNAPPITLKGYLHLPSQADADEQLSLLIALLSNKEPISLRMIDPSHKESSFLVKCLQHSLQPPITTQPHYLAPLTLTFKKITPHLPA